MSVLAELGVARPVPLVFDRSPLTHQAQQCLWACAQGGQEIVDLAEGLTAASPSADQFDDPAGTSPTLADGVCGIAGTEHPAHLAAMTSLDIADHHWEVTVAAELGDDLLKQAALVAFNGQEHLGALLGGELKYAGEVCSASA
jgi:hypothetical protein